MLRMHAILRDVGYSTAEERISVRNGDIERLLKERRVDQEIGATGIAGDGNIPRRCQTHQVFGKIRSTLS